MQHAVERRYLGPLRRLLRQFPAVTVLRPRQCGKTTFIRQALPAWRYGLLHYFLGIDSVDRLHEHPARGMSWEAFVIDQLLSALERTAPRCRPYFWRTAQGDEGSHVATVTIDPTADGTAEADKTVTLTVTAGAGYTAATPSAATTTIVNDD